MFRKITVFIIVTLLSNGFTTHAQTASAQEIKFKRQVVEYGAEQKVKVKMQSGETLKGRIAEIKNDSFTLQFVDATGQVTNRELAYSELSKVSKMKGKEAGNALKRGFLYGAGFYVGLLAVAGVAFGIAAATAR